MYLKDHSIEISKGKGWYESWSIVVELGYQQELLSLIQVPMDIYMYTYYMLSSILHKYMQYNII